eukprot:gene37564-45624_t
MPPKPQWLKHKIEANRKKLEEKTASSSSKRKAWQAEYVLWLDEELATYEPFMKEFNLVSLPFPEASSDVGKERSSSEQRISSSNEGTNESVLRHAIRKNPIPKFICWSSMRSATVTGSQASINLSSAIAVGVIPMSNAHFIKTALKSADGIEFLDLANLIGGYYEALQRETGKPWRLILGFIDLPQAICNAQKQDQNADTNVQHWVEQACLYLTMEFNVETVRFTRYGELCEYLCTMTRVVQATAEKDGAGEMIDNVQRGIKQKIKDGVVMTEEEKRKFELKQTWAAMLQMIPRISQEKALALVSNPEFSCPKKFFDRIATSSEEEVVEMLKTSFGKTKSGAVRNEHKLAQVLYTMFTTDDPSQPFA